jgi:E3 ubiquitin-protein ligase DOA10
MGNNLKSLCLHCVTSVCYISNTTENKAMKKLIIILTNVLSAAIILDSLNAIHAVCYFVIAGQIPGTSMTLDSETMFALFLALIGILIGRLSFWMYTVLSSIFAMNQRA